MKKSVVFLLLCIFSISVFAQKNKPISKNSKDKSKVEKVQLSDLPQTPKVPKETTDAQDEGLKGKVKEIKEEIKFLSDDYFFEKLDDWKGKNRKLSKIIYFDNLGFLLRKDYYGHTELSERIIYGYIDGKRVSKSISFLKNPPKAVSVKDNSSSNKEVLKKTDKRYGLSYIYEYKDGKLVEMKMFHNNGSKWMRHIYKYSDKQIEKIIFTEDDKVNVQSLLNLDELGNIIEETQTGSNKKTIRYSYKYEFDNQGNWIKCLQSVEVAKNGKTFFQPDYETYRTITYW